MEMVQGFMGRANLKSKLVQKPATQERASRKKRVNFEVQSSGEKKARAHTRRNSRGMISEAFTFRDLNVMAQMEEVSNSESSFEEKKYANQSRQILGNKTN